MKNLFFIVTCFNFLQTREKRDFFVVMLLAALAALSELIGLTSVIPVVGHLVSPSSQGWHTVFIDSMPEFKSFSKEYFLVYVSVFFILLSAILRVLHSYVRMRFTKILGANISTRVLSNYLDSPLELFQRSSESEVVRNIGQVGGMTVRGVLGSTIDIVAKTMLLVFVVGLLLIINWGLTLSICALLCLVYMALNILIKPYVKRRAKENFELAKSLHDIKVNVYRAFGLIKIDQSASLVLSKFSSVRHYIARRQAQMGFLSGLPKLTLETLGLIVLLFYALYLDSQEGGATALIQNMGVFALCSYRVLPAIQRLYGAINTITGVRVNAETVIAALEAPEKGSFSENSIQEPRNIIVNNVSYRYSGCEEYALQGVNLIIETVGIHLLEGGSGVGKSTLMELMLGLRSPSAGTICLDDSNISSALRSWQVSVSYVPQRFYPVENCLIDIVTGSSQKEFSNTSYSRAIQASGLQGVIEKLSLGEAGNLDFNSLSGGEKNRVALARALYSSSRIIFLDEPFSGLDLSSANKVCEQLRDLYSDRCFIVISHRAEELGVPVNKLSL